MITFEFGIMSSKYSCEAENKLTAYVTMIAFYGSNNFMVVIYSPEDCANEDQWFNPTGKVSERIDEIFGGENAFDKYVESHVAEIKTCYKTIKKLV
jgi:hypothetical protein